LPDAAADPGAEARIAEAQQAVDNLHEFAPPFCGTELFRKNAQIGEMVSPISAGGGLTRNRHCDDRGHESNEIEVGRERSVHRQGKENVKKWRRAGRVPGGKR